ncbi:hypothetical protein CK203_076091 [Vitis vinifera]|uniref:LRR receptor-like serine/threonine-protein kinase n=1 Tax=Vitis vinifera TaxID=29760 RepID=A0A438EMC6_VITVI|nr:hypothetical protein CK203_076091 [Vitis vinifera]
MAKPCLLLAFCSFFFFFFLPCLSCPAHQKQALLQFKSSILAITSSLNSLFTDLSPQPRVQSTILAPIFTSEAWSGFTSQTTTYKVKSRQLGLQTLAIWLGLYMSGNNFSGSIPPQLFHLPFLQYLSLDGNSLSGEVPEEFGNLTSLQVLLLD